MEGQVLNLEDRITTLETGPLIIKFAYMLCPLKAVKLVLLWFKLLWNSVFVPLKHKWYYFQMYLVKVQDNPLGNELRGFFFLNGQK